jgi:tetrapyrrole methylase family protein/MazG family protein
MTSSGITVVGLGPGPEDLWTARALRTLEGATELWVRTARHPAAHALARLAPALQSCDDLYESHADLPSVYAAIAERLVGRAAATAVVYAVPGDPVVGEASVRLLREAAAAQAIPFELVHGLSFVAPCAASLGWDVLDGLQVVDAMEIALCHHPHIDPDRPAM